MSLNSIVNRIGKANIASDISVDKLNLIADEVIERANQDSRSMSEWIDAVKEGIELCKPEFKSKDTPWPNAANFKATILSEAANSFGNRASVEIMRDPKLVKSEIIGLTTIKNVIDKKASEVSRWKDQVESVMQQMQELDPNDPQVQKMQKVAEEIQAKVAENMDTIKRKKEDMRKKSERADRVSELMNWQVNSKMEEWRSDQKRLMYSLPNVGCLFKKTYYDETLGRCVSKTINFPDFLINQKTSCMKTCRSFTHIIAFTKAEADLRVAQGIWLDPKVYTDEDTGDAGSNEAAESNTEDNENKFYEQYCWIDLDQDGVEEPYIVTVHVGSCKVVRIVARYDEDTIIVKADGIKPLPLIDAQKKRAKMIMAENQEYNTATPIPDPEDLSEYSLVRIEPVGIITKYGMIPSANGDFLDVGFYHLIGSMTAGVNKTTNDLLNSGTLANTQSGMVAKGFLRKGGEVKLQPGRFIQTEMPPELLATSVMRLPFGEPSVTLFQLNEKMEQTARGFSANADVGGQIQSNTAPTTALAMIQENMIPHTAHMSMIIDSMSHEFGILFALNRTYLDPDEYKEVVGDDEAVFSEDFETDGLSIKCGANPEMSSKMQRMMLATAELEQVDRVIQAGGNPVPIIKGYYKRIGSENLDEIFPNEAEMSPEEKQQMEMMRQQQEYANQLAEKQVQLIELQTQLLQAGEKRKDFEAQIKAQETTANMDLTLEQVEETKSKTVLNYEKAESEQVKNQISTYTALNEVTAKEEELGMMRDFD